MSSSIDVLGMTVALLELEKLRNISVVPVSRIRVYIVLIRVGKDDHKAEGHRESWSSDFKF
jgi:hypothetical protein